MGDFPQAIGGIVDWDMTSGSSIRRLVASAYTSVFVLTGGSERSQKCNERSFVICREFQSKLVSPHRTSFDAIAFEAGRNIIIAKSGRVEPVHGELQNRLNSGDFLDFDTLPGCSTSSSFSFI